MQVGFNFQSCVIRSLAERPMKTKSAIISREKDERIELPTKFSHSTANEFCQCFNGMGRGEIAIFKVGSRTFWHSKGEPVHVTKAAEQQVLPASILDSWSTPFRPCQTRPLIFSLWALGAKIPLSLDLLLLLYKFSKEQPPCSFLTAFPRPTMQALAAGTSELLSPATWFFL